MSADLAARLAAAEDEIRGLQATIAQHCGCLGGAGTAWDPGPVVIDGEVLDPLTPRPLSTEPVTYHRVTPAGRR